MKLRAALEALLLGTLVILAGCGGGQNSSSSQTPPPAPTLNLITVSPSSAQIVSGSTQQFTATGKYSDGSSQDLTTVVSWSASPSTVANINFSGAAQALKTGTSTVMASKGSIHGSATLNVTNAPLVSISITSKASSLPAGTSLQLKAIGIFQDGSTQDLSGSVTWTSSSSAVASVGTTGMLQGLMPGTTLVSASQGSIIGTASFRVTAATLASLAITPASASIAKQTTQQFSAIGTYSDGTVQNVTSQVSWASSQPSVASVNDGLAFGLAPGSAIISATSGSARASASLTVTNATVTSITITPGTATVVVGLFQQFRAVGLFNDGTTQDLSGVVTWATSVPSVATTNSAGLACGLAEGTTTISAAFEQVTGMATLTVNAPSLVSISLTPSSATIAVTTVSHFFVIGHYNDGSTQLLTGASWSSSNPAVATMNGNIASGLQPGTATISATLNSFSAAATLTVTSATLVSIAVTPANASIAPGTTKGFSANGTFSDGSTQNITELTNWSSSSLSVATMNANNATAIAAGNTTIGAAFDGVTGSTSLTVTPTSMTSFAISPSNATTVVGANLQFSATATFSDGSTQDVTTAVTWQSSLTSVATISGGGTTTGEAGGTTTISATYNGQTVSTSLTVSSATLVSLTVSPLTTAVAPGLSRAFSATGTFSDGTVQNVTAMVHWTSSDSTVASISNSGNVGTATGISTGWVRISAVLSSVVASAVLNVNNATLTSIEITPANPTLSLGMSQQMSATGTFSDGSAQDITQWVSWSSSDVQVCVIGNAGFVTTSGSGTATITASFNSVTATTTVTVF